MADEFLCDLKVPSPDSLISSMKMLDWYRMDDRSFDGGDDYFNLNWELKEDVCDRLPSDPFEMNISIRGWIQDVDDEIGYIKISDGDEINIEDANGLILFDGSKESNHGKQALQSINQHNRNCCDGDGDGDLCSPPDALFFALSYLEIRDLLAVEGVCKSLRDGVRNDPLLWRTIHVQPPPGGSFADESLLRITDRAAGSLQSLSLVKCFNITDNGLKNVFQRNPRLTKLSVEVSLGLSMEGLLSNMKSLKSAGGAGIKRLRIGSLHNITMEQFEEMKKVLSIDNQNLLSSPKPRFFHGGDLYLSLDDDRPIDIEACPKCHQLVEVFDCPAESCQGRRNCCRACRSCILRCAKCGSCFSDRDYVETFCLDFVCFDCLKLILSLSDGEEEDLSTPAVQSSIYRRASYHVFLLSKNLYAYKSAGMC